MRHRGSSSSWTYLDLDRYQRKWASEVRRGAEGVLIFSELSPVITLGQRAQKDPVEGGLKHRPQEYFAAGIPIIEVERGGLATWHGPGQWVVFPVEQIEKLTGDSRGVRRAVDLLLGVAQDTAQAFGVKTEIREGSELGLWGNGGKLASVGIKISEGVLQHGMAFNVFRNEQSFWGLNPCGLEAPVSFLESEWEDSRLPVGVRDSVFVSVGQSLARNFSRRLQDRISLSRLDAPGIWG